MISARGATPCNMMLHEVGRAHVAHAVPIQFQPGEVFKVWDAVSQYCRGALLAGINVTLFRKTISFSCSRRRTFKKIPASFHREAQLYDVRVPLFGVSPSYAVTYSLDSPIVEERSFTYTQMPLKAIADSARVPVGVVAAVLHDVMRFIGEALFQGRLLELEFPGLAIVRAKRDRVMTTFDHGFIAELLAIDTRKWPAAFAREARELLLPGPKPAGQQQQQRPSSARPSSARSGAGSKAVSGNKGEQKIAHNAPFCNAPAPAGRTFDEMNEILVNDHNRKTRSASARRPASAASSSGRGGSGAAVAAAAISGRGVGADGLAVVYDESVPAASLARSPYENVYDMVMPSSGLDMTTSAGGGGGGAAPQAYSHAPPLPLPRPEQQQQQQQQFAPPVRNAAASSSSSSFVGKIPAGASTAALHRPSSGSSAANMQQQQQQQRAPRHLNTNTHINIFGWLGEPVQMDEAAHVSRKRRLDFVPSLGTA